MTGIRRSGKPRALRHHRDEVETMYTICSLFAICSSLVPAGFRVKLPLQVAARGLWLIQTGFEPASPATEGISLKFGKTNSPKNQTPAGWEVPGWGLQYRAFGKA